MKITYDPPKRLATLTERGLNFDDAALVFKGKTIQFEDVRFDYPEPRFITIGYLAGRMVMVVWTPDGAGRRIISMRKVNVKEQKRYRKRLGED